MGKDAKKAAVSDEWRQKDVEERLSYSLIKVSLGSCGYPSRSFVKYRYG